MHAVEDQTQENHYIDKVNQIHKYLVDWSHLEGTDEAGLEESGNDHVRLESLHGNVDRE